MKYLFLPLYLFLLFAGNVQAQLNTNGQTIDSIADSALESTFNSSTNSSINPTTSALGSIQPAQLGIERPELIDETLVLRGQITNFDFTQPETRILIDTNLEQWELIAPSAVELRRLGWTSSSLFSGELVEVEAVRLLGADPAGIKNKASLKRLTRANGALLLTSISRPEPTGFENIEGGMYSLETDHSDLEFSYNHMGFVDLDVEFERMNADVLWNKNSPELSIIQLNIDASSLRSGVAALDETLRGQAFFDSFNYPRIQFRSTQIRLLKWGNLQIDGQLEIRDIKQPVRLEATLNKSAINPMTQELTVGLSLTGTVKRSDWGLAGYQQMVKDEITISFNGEFTLKAADIPSTSLSANPLARPSAFAEENNPDIYKQESRPIEPVVTPGN